MISTEFSLVSIVLIILFIFGISLWNLSSLRLNEYLIKNELFINTIDISDQLLRSQGNPTDWESNATKLVSLGIVSKANKLDAKKVIALQNVSYDKMKDSLGIKTHEIYIKITDLSGNIVQLNGTNSEVGLKPIADSNTINFQRTALLDGGLVYVNVVVWK